MPEPSVARSETGVSAKPLRTRHLRLLVQAVLAAALVVVCLVCFIVARLLLLGPYGIKPGDVVISARTRFADNSEFVILSQRTPFVTEPYEVTLFRVQPNHETSSYYLAFEDPYWWNCTIRSNEAAGTVEIRVGSAIVATYLPADDSIKSRAYGIPIKARCVQYSELQQLISAARKR